MSLCITYNHNANIAPITKFYTTDHLIGAEHGFVRLVLSRINIHGTEGLVVSRIVTDQHTLSQYCVREL
jgi:hypothetical protein